MGRIEKTIYAVLALFFVGVLFVIFMVPAGDIGPRARASANVTESEVKVTEEPETEEKQEKVEYYSSDEVLDYLNGLANDAGTWEMRDETYFVFYPDEELSNGLSFLYEYPNDENLLEDYHGILDTMKSYTKSVDNACGKTCRLAIASPIDNNNVMAEFENEEVVYDAIANL